MARVAVVSGGTRGIGAAVSRALAKAGYRVAAIYAGNDEAAAKFKSETGIPVYKWDVSDYEACAAGLAKVSADLGPVEVLVNNAGITRDAMLHKMKPEQWNAVINTNLNSLFNMTRPVIEGMRERNFGRIVNISSINGLKGQMGQTNYSASKAGDIGFSKSLAQENAKKGVTVNVICAGLYSDGNGRGDAEGRSGKDDSAANTRRPSWQARRNRALRALPDLGGRRIYHRLDAVGQRRSVHGLTRQWLVLFFGLTSASEPGGRDTCRSSGRCDAGGAIRQNPCLRHRSAPRAHRPSGGSRASWGRFSASGQPFHSSR